MIKYCPNCGVKLPETMNTSPDELTLEKAKAAAGSGFDTPGPLPAQPGGQVPEVKRLPVKKTNPVLSLIILIIIAIAMFWGFKSLFEPVRNCIGSVLGSPPECSDCEPVYRKTTLNGNPMGNCIAIPGTGTYEDQCEIECK